MAKQTEMLERFGLHDGQFFGGYKYKNLWWTLNGVDIGFGDLRSYDIVCISVLLKEDEKFVGWHESRGMPHQQTEHPMVIIENKRITYRDEIINKARIAGRGI